MDPGILPFGTAFEEEIDEPFAWRSRATRRYRGARTGTIKDQPLHGPACPSVEARPDSDPLASSASTMPAIGIEVAVDENVSEDQVPTATLCSRLAGEDTRVIVLSGGLAGKGFGPTDRPFAAPSGVGNSERLTARASRATVGRITPDHGFCHCSVPLRPAFCDNQAFGSCANPMRAKTGRLGHRPTAANNLRGGICHDPRGRGENDCAAHSSGSHR